MKRNHIAIAGILASVLVTMDAAWADTATVIASQAYVDAKVGTKLNSSALNAGTLSTTSTTTVPSEQTVYNAIQNAAPSASNYISDGTTALSLTADTDKAPSVSAVQGSVLYSGNTASTNTKTANVDVTNIAANSAVFTTNTTVKADGDSYVPTVAAVEARVKAINIPTVPATTDTKSATYDSSDHTLTVATTGDGASTTKTATPKQVANTITDVKSYIDYKDSLKANSADLGALATLDAVGSAQITDGSIATGDLASNAVTTAKITDLNVTTAKLAADAVTNAKLADDAVQTENIKDLTITNDDISNTANIAYTKMNGTLKDVNSDSADATCTAASPCVLTYYKIGSTVYYKWTNLIETDGVTALPAS